MTDSEKSPDHTFDIGDYIFAVYYYEFLVGNEDKGAWHVAYGRVVSVGTKKVCYELASGNLGGELGGDGGGLHDSKIRWVDLPRAFPDADAAHKMAASLPRPKK